MCEYTNKTYFKLHNIYGCSVTDFNNEFLINFIYKYIMSLALW